MHKSHSFPTLVKTLFMPNHLLYFPYINLPQNEWTMRSLIYYDSVGTIVPDEYFYNPNLYEPFMADLVRENLVVPINPIHSLNDPFSLVDPFIEFVSRPGYRIAEKRKRFEHYNETFRINGRKFVPSNINGQKFNAELLYRLEILGLARRSEGNWYNVETITAGYLMSYLSNIIAKKLELLPATDKPLIPNGRPYHKQIGNPIEEKRRREVLKGVIPFPLEVDLRRLSRIKDKHGEDISQLRNIIEQIAFDQKYDDDRLLQAKIQELNHHKEQLLSKFSESRIAPIIFGTAMGLTGAVYGYATADHWSGAIGGFPGFANAVYSALQIEAPEKIIDPSGMKYLAILEAKTLKA